MVTLGRPNLRSEDVPGALSDAPGFVLSLEVMAGLRRFFLPISRRGSGLRDFFRGSGGAIRAYSLNGPQWYLSADSCTVRSHKWLSGSPPRWLSSRLR